uniref:Derlin n=1 Tax=Chromulina nebulosa TaxID=96789 RepID=A0A7S0SWB6_9STRA|mmetsp:Transcript_3984/g.3577  ORF Transcript_3984/g.3577 Transcript_3984/m.3577 type:complete len:272 (+) Transcript_3984:51-866(+)
MRRPVAQVGQGDSIQDWYNNIPFVTKVLITSTVVIGGLLTFQLIPPQDLILDWRFIWHKFHIWRLFTPFVFAGSFSFNFLMHTVVLYQNSLKYENNPYNTGGGGSSADYLYLIIYSIVLLLVIAYYMNFMILSDPLMYVIVYVWSRRESESVVNMYGFKFKGLYLPWIYIGISMLMGNSIVPPLIGIAVGHSYYFLIEVMPTIYNVDLIRTPKFCIDIITYSTGRTPNVLSNIPIPNLAAAPNAGAPVRGNGFPNLGTGHNWGRGRVLGAN